MGHIEKHSMESAREVRGIIKINRNKRQTRRCHEDIKNEIKIKKGKRKKAKNKSKGICTTSNQAEMGRAW